MKQCALSSVILSLCLYAGFCCDPGFYFFDGKCFPCPPGTFQSQAAQNGCTPCPPRHIQAQYGKDSCTECGVHSMPNANANACECIPGSFRDPISNQCSLCPAGTYSDSSYVVTGSGLACVECLPNTFQSEAGQTSCIACAPWSYSLAGATECLVCEEGEAGILSPSQGSSGSNGKPTLVCGKCAAGTFLTFSRTCERCEESFFKAEEGQQPCVPCAVNQYSTADRTACFPCEAGTAKMEDGSCGKCPPGSFYQGRLPSFQRLQGLETNSYCSACGVNTFMDYENVRMSCFECAGDSFSFGGATKCIRCAQDKVLMKNGTCATCPPGTVYAGFECEPCPQNQFTRRINDGTCKTCPLVNLYSFSGDSTCFFSDCAEGSKFIHSEGKCGQCPAGTQPTFSNACSPCVSGSVKPDRGEHGCTRCEEGKTNNGDFTECVPLTS